MGYVIHVGHTTPGQAFVSEVDREGNPIGHRTDVLIGVGGHGMPTMARVWCRRVLSNGKLKKDKDGNDTQIEAQDPEYRGSLEFLKWGDNKLGAQAIEIRYLPHSNSLDYQYQILVQKIVTKPEDGFDQLILNPGENKFDEADKGVLIQFLKVYPQNRDSISKNPSPMIQGYMFYEVTEDRADKKVLKSREAGVINQSFVMKLADKEGQLYNLLEVLTKFGKDFGKVNYLSNTSDVYSALLDFAQNEPGDFGKMINEYKKSLQDMFDKADAYKALDLSKEGFIGFERENKKTMVFEEIPGKGKKMLEWVIENYLEDEVYKRSKMFAGLCEQLK